MSSKNRNVTAPDNTKWTLTKTGKPLMSRNSGYKAEKYPFAIMDVGESFFLPVTKDVPEPWVRYASAVSAANARYRKAKQPHVFSCHKVRKGDIYSDGFTESEDGARVFRTK